MTEGPATKSRSAIRVGEAACEFDQDLPFPGGELAELGVGGFGWPPGVGDPAREDVEEAPGHARGDDGVAVGDGPDGPDELQERKPPPWERMNFSSGKRVRTPFVASDIAARVVSSRKSHKGRVPRHLGLGQ